MDTAHLIDNPMTLSTSSAIDNESESDIDYPGQLSSDHDERRTLFSAGLIVHSAIDGVSDVGNSWPPSSASVGVEVAECIVPDSLFNLIAWCVGASDDPTLSKRDVVHVDKHSKILSIAQDIIYLASRGKKQTPKSLTLGMTLRHLTGSSRLVTLMHRLGHCTSWDTIHRLEISLAQVQLLAANDIPNNFSKEVPTVLIWDNIDFSQETLSG